MAANYPELNIDWPALRSHKSKFWLLGSDLENDIRTALIFSFQLESASGSCVTILPTSAYMHACMMPYACLFFFFSTTQPFSNIEYAPGLTYRVFGRKRHQCHPPSPGSLRPDPLAGQLARSEVDQDRILVAVHDDAARVEIVMSQSQGVKAVHQAPDPFARVGHVL